MSMKSRALAMLDAVFCGFRWWRKLRGGKWEYREASCASPVAFWRRVETWTPTVTAREDYRR